MRKLPTVMSLVRRALHGSLSLVGDSIEALGSGEYREDLQRRIRTCAERGAELALENARLRDRVDSLRFNGPTLWKDEVEAISYVLGLTQHREPDVYRALLSLLRRCDHMGVTQDELNEQVEGIIDGTADVHLWDDRGRDVDHEPCPECHGSPRPRMTSDACGTCGSLGRFLTGDSW